MADAVQKTGLPLGFCARAGKSTGPVADRPGDRDEITVEARGLGGHLKEALVTEGEDGACWRLLSDEGRHLKGADSAPFPLGFFNAGLQGDLYRRLLGLASERNVALGEVSVSLRNFYSMTGSFTRGDGKGFSEPAEIVLEGSGGLPEPALLALLTDAAALSPAIDAMRRPIENSFALYVNDRRRKLTVLREAGGADAQDPYLKHAAAPVPDAAAPKSSVEVITKTGVVEAGDLQPAPSGTKERILRTVAGIGRLVDDRGLVAVDTWLELPGVSHFQLAMDERPAERAAPTGLSQLAAGVAFCFMTQLSRYIEHLKLNIGDVRLVQRTPFAIAETPDGPRGEAFPVETHLFLNGRDGGAEHERLMQVAVRTCYLHATLASTLPPRLVVKPFAAHAGQRSAIATATPR